MTALVALTIRNVEFHADRVFDPASQSAMRASLRPMASPWPYVHAAAAERGVRLMTADRLEAEGIDPRNVRLLAYDWTPAAEDLISRGAQPIALLSMEPPVIAWSLYTNLPRLSQLFPHVFLFEGARQRVSPSAQFHSLRFPLPCPPPRARGLPWSERRHMVMVNSNKALAGIAELPRWFDRPREVSLKRGLAALQYPPVRANRYLERIRVVAALRDVDLYGEGWERRHPAVPEPLHRAALAVYRGPAGDKLELLGQYRFALAVENTRFPGYVSEKLFDCFFAGCIPIYDGAPDVASYVPQQAFIDRSAFATDAELDRFIRDLSPVEVARYREAADEFVASSAFEQFCAQSLARELSTTF